MIATGKLVSGALLLSLTLLLACDCARAQIQPAHNRSLPDLRKRNDSRHREIGQHADSGRSQFPSRSNLAAQKIAIWTDVDGIYSAAVPSYGSYTVRVEMIAFANSTQQVVIDATHQNVPANFELTLLIPHTRGE